jgi:hypothetical protein
MLIFRLIRKIGVLRILKTMAALAVLSAVIGPPLYIYLKYFTHEKRVVRQRLSEADEKSEASINPRLKPLTDLFAKGRKGAKAFAGRAVSWRGKWEMMKGLTDHGESHRAFLSEEYANLVFSPDDFRKAMEASVKAYLDDIEGYEAEMLVKLRADLADPDRPVGSLPSHLQSNDLFRQHYHTLSSSLVTELNLNMGGFVGRELGTMWAATMPANLAGQAARAAAIEMGFSAGLLGTGGASFVATVGVGCVVALIIERIVDEVLRLVGMDPETNIAKLVCSSIDELEAALTKDAVFLGLGKKGSLRVLMEEIHETRSKLRRETITRLLKEGGLK